MTVNGGTTNNSIFFSELQSAFGGTHPIFLNEYYRGGEVSTQRTVTALNANSASGTASNTTGGVAVAVTTVVNPGTLEPNRAALDIFSPTGSYTVRADTSVIGLTAIHPDAGGGRSTVTLEWTINGNAQTDLTTTDNQGNGAALSAGYVRGPAYVNGDQSNITPTTPFANTAVATVAAGAVIRITDDGRGRGLLQPRRRTGAGTTFNHTITNNTGQTLNLTSSPWGNDGSFTNGESHSTTGRASNSWSWSHPSVSTTSSDANSNIPSSGSIDMNDFRSITNYTPG